MQFSRTLQRRFLLSLFFGIAVFFGLMIYGDAGDILDALRGTRWAFVPAVFGLAALNYLFRFFRWQMYLAASHISLPFKQSLTVFLSGLSMSVTPGKVGEVIKAYFVKTLSGTPMSKTLAVVFAERFTDLFAVVILAAIGALSFQYGWAVTTAGVVIVVAILIIAMSRKLAEPLIRRFGRLPKSRTFSEKLLRLYDHSTALLRPRLLGTGLVVAALAWFSECLAFFLVLKSLNLPLGLWQATFIYAFSTLFGAITLLPGGLATTEGSMTGLLTLQGVARDGAAAATIVIRVATLWFAVAVGMICFLPYRRMLNELNTVHPTTNGAL